MALKALALSQLPVVQKSTVNFCRRMVSMSWGRGVNGCVWALAASIVFASLVPSLMAGTDKKNDPGPKADVRIPVASLGYTPPNSFYLIARLSSVSLDFIDKDHLLFTFRVPGLMQRLPDCPPGDEDQSIRAVVLKLPEGEVVSKADWRMHDHSRYLWRLDDGRFLVRQRSTLFLTDKSLELEQFVHSETPLASVQISPDRKLMVLEAEGVKEKRKNVASIAPTLGDPDPEAKPVQLFVLRTETRAVIAHSEALDAMEVPLVDEGYLQAIAAKDNKWMIRYRPFRGEARQLAELDSTCRPTIEMVSKDVSLVITCPRSGNDHVVTAVSMEGKKLWEQRWESRYIWPTFQLAQDGSRFAYSSLQVSHSIGTMDPVDETNIMNQMVGVFDTQTGHLSLVKNATPILSAGQNYALSQDGLRMAILREGAIEIYNLSPVAGEAAPPPKKH
jgi:hypothetical protein